VLDLGLVLCLGLECRVSLGSRLGLGSLLLIDSRTDAYNSVVNVYNAHDAADSS